MQTNAKESTLLNKGIALCITTVLLALFVALMPIKAYGDGELTIKVGETGEVAAGNEFTVPISIEGNPGFAAAALQLNYDKNALEYVRFETNGFLKSGLIENVDESTIGYFSGTDISDNGVLFSAVFRVKADAQSGNYDIQISLKGNLASNLVNAKAETLSANFVSGAVQIKGTGATSNPSGNNGQSDTNTSEGSQVTATAPDGSHIEFLLRDSANGKEYSFDYGKSWTAVPQNGIITSPDGKMISIDGSQGADYYVVEGTSAGDEGPTARIIPPALIIGIGVVLIIILVILIVKLRRDSSKKAYQQINRVFKESLPDTKQDSVNINRVNTDRVNTNRVNTDRVNTDRVKTDRVNSDRAITDRVNTDRVNTDRVNTDRVNTNTERSRHSRESNPVEKKGRALKEG